MSIETIKRLERAAQAARTWIEGKDILFGLVSDLRAIVALGGPQGRLTGMDAENLAESLERITVLRAAGQDCENLRAAIGHTQALLRRMAADAAERLGREAGDLRIHAQEAALSDVVQQKGETRPSRLVACRPGAGPAGVVPTGMGRSNLGSLHGNCRALRLPVSRGAAPPGAVMVPRESFLDIPEGEGFLLHVTGLVASEIPVQPPDGGYQTYAVEAGQGGVRVFGPAILSRGGPARNIIMERWAVARALVIATRYAEADKQKKKINLAQIRALVPAFGYGIPALTVANILEKGHFTDLLVISGLASIFWTILSLVSVSLLDSPEINPEYTQSQDMIDRLDKDTIEEVKSFLAAADIETEDTAWLKHPAEKVLVSSRIWFTPPTHARVACGGELRQVSSMLALPPPSRDEDLLQDGLAAHPVLQGA